MKKIIIYWIIFLCLFVSIIPGNHINVNANSKDRYPFDATDKEFNLIDVNPYYLAYKYSDGIPISDIDYTTGNYEIISGTDITFVDGYHKPQGFLHFPGTESETEPDTLIAFSKMYHNITKDTEIVINIYYEKYDNTASFYNIDFIYSDYYNPNLDNEINNQYYYNGKTKLEQSTNNLESRASNLCIDQTNTIFYPYHETTETHTKNFINVRNISVERPTRIRDKTWTTVILPSEAFIHESSTYFSYQFIHLSLKKSDPRDDFIIESIILKNKKPASESIPLSPFLEFWEFNTITDTGTNTFFSVDMVHNDYYTGKISRVSLGINSDKKLWLNYASPNTGKSQNITINEEIILDSKKDDGTTVITYNAAYQIYIAKNPGTPHYNIYLYLKYDANKRGPAPLHDVAYKYEFLYIQITEVEFSFLANFEYYNNNVYSTQFFSYIERSQKWDIIDMEIRRIDYTAGSGGEQVTLVQDIDRPGSVIPGIDDIKSALKNIIIIPVNNLFNNLIRILTVQINIIRDLLNSLSAGITNVQTGISNIGTSITNAINNIPDTINTHIQNAVSSLNTTLGGKLDSVISAFSSLESVVNLVTTAVQNVPGSIWGLFEASLTTIIDNVQSIYTEIQTILTTLETFYYTMNDLFIWISGEFNTTITNFITFINSAYDGIVNLYNETKVIIWDIVDLINDFIVWFIDILYTLYDFLNVFLTIGFLFLGVTFFYGTIMGLANYADSGDTRDLMIIIETYEKIIRFIWTVFDLIIKAIAGIIP